MNGYFREQIGARDANKMMVFDGATAAGNGRFRVSNAKSAWTRQGCLAENSHQNSPTLGMLKRKDDELHRYYAKTVLQILEGNKIGI